MGIFNRNRSKAPTPVTSLTAGGSTYNAGQYTDATYVNQLRQAWQQKVFDIYDTEGHLFYATNYVGGAMSRIRLVAAKKPIKTGELARPVVIEDGPVAEMVKLISSAKGGQSGFLRQTGRNMFLVGEVWIAASEIMWADGLVHTQYDAISVDEIQTAAGSSSNFMRKPLPGAQPIPLPKNASVYRIWKEHPRFSELADSGARSCLELLEKIIILNRAEKAVARSQLAGAGILALPQELVPPSMQNQDKNADPTQSNPLWASLAEAMTAPLRDESVPSAVVPWLLVGPADIISKLRYEPMARKFDTAAANKSIEGAIEQIANTLEIPKEILLGVGEATHWTAWAIREDVFQAHIQPLIELVCDALTRTFLRGALRKLAPADLANLLTSLGVDTVDDIIVWYDASQLVQAPDKGDKYAAAHDRFVVTDEAYANALNIPKEDRLDKSSEEYAKRVGLKMVDPHMAITGEPPKNDPGKLGGVAPGSGTAAPGGGKSGPLP